MKRPYSAAKKRAIAARIVRQLGEIREASPAAYREAMQKLSGIAAKQRVLNVVDKLLAPGPAHDRDGVALILEAAGRYIRKHEDAAGTRAVIKAMIDAASPELFAAIFSEVVHQEEVHAEIAADCARFDLGAA